MPSRPKSRDISSTRFFPEDLFPGRKKGGKHSTELQLQKYYARLARKGPSQKLQDLWKTAPRKQAPWEEGCGQGKATAWNAFQSCEIPSIGNLSLSSELGSSVWDAILAQLEKKVQQKGQKATLNDLLSVGQTIASKKLPTMNWQAAYEGAKIRTRPVPKRQRALERLQGLEGGGRFERKSDKSKSKGFYGKKGKKGKFQKREEDEPEPEPEYED